MFIFIPNTPKVKKIKLAYELVKFNEGDILMITQGLHEVMIITNQKHERKIVQFY